MNDNSPPSSPLHVPVLPAEVLALLDPQPGQIIVDATVGAGGHARLLAGRVGSMGRVIGLGRVREADVAQRARLRRGSPAHRQGGVDRTRYGQAQPGAVQTGSPA